VKADAGRIAAPAVVMTMYVVVVAPHVAVKPATLLAPAATTGVTEGKKKEAG
jgi:formaldehyde-activating enzyme involved in methanogenesis